MQVKVKKMNTDKPLSTGQEASLMQFLSTIGTDDLIAARKFLEVCSWDVSTAVDRWFT